MNNDFKEYFEVLLGEQWFKDFAAWVKTQAPIIPQFTASGEITEEDWKYESARRHGYFDALAAMYIFDVKE